MPIDANVQQLNSVDKKKRTDKLAKCDYVIKPIKERNRYRIHI